MNIFIVDLESVETRYTCEWKKGLPNALETYARSHQIDANVFNISGVESEMVTTPGAFLNFTGTNIYKSQQAIKVAELFQEGKVKPGDVFLFADAWNPTIFQVKYMSELLDIPVVLYGIWHAGSYDPMDFLGRKIKDKRWSKAVELGLFHALDKNVFATSFHVDLFTEGVLGSKKAVPDEDTAKVLISGQPHDVMVGEFEKITTENKRDLIVFPHRVAPEKQPEIFKDLAATMPEYEWVICQDKKLSKDEYRKLLSESKITFSANLQETLGISAMEAVLVNSFPLVPDRLSYKEMYLDTFKYPSIFTDSWESYQKHKHLLVDQIKNIMENHDSFKHDLRIQKNILKDDFLTAQVMFDSILGRLDSSYVQKSD